MEKNKPSTEKVNDERVFLGNCLENFIKDYRNKNKSLPEKCVLNPEQLIDWVNTLSLQSCIVFGGWCIFALDTIEALKKGVNEPSNGTCIHYFQPLIEMVGKRILGENYKSSLILDIRLRKYRSLF